MAIFTIAVAHRQVPRPSPSSHHRHRHRNLRRRLRHSPSTIVIVIGIVIVIRLQHPSFNMQLQPSTSTSTSEPPTSVHQLSAIQLAMADAGGWSPPRHGSDRRNRSEPWPRHGAGGTAPETWAEPTTAWSRESQHRPHWQSQPRWRSHQWQDQPWQEQTEERRWRKGDSVAEVGSREGGSGSSSRRAPNVAGARPDPREQDWIDRAAAETAAPANAGGATPEPEEEEVEWQSVPVEMRTSPWERRVGHYLQEAALWTDQQRIQGFGSATLLPACEVWRLWWPGNVRRTLPSSGPERREIDALALELDLIWKVKDRGRRKVRQGRDDGGDRAARLTILGDATKAVQLLVRLLQAARAMGVSVEDIRRVRRAARLEAYSQQPTSMCQTFKRFQINYQVSMSCIVSFHPSTF